MNVIKLHVYAIPPIDFWTGWHLFDPTESLFVDLLVRFELGKELAQSIGWEGDIRRWNGPFWAPIPPYEFLVAWKQNNNGRTFVVSPYELPWLDEKVTTAFEHVIG